MLTGQVKIRRMPFTRFVLEVQKLDDFTYEGLRVDKGIYASLVQQHKTQKGKNVEVIKENSRDIKGESLTILIGRVQGRELRCIQGPNG